LCDNYALSDHPLAEIQASMTEWIKGSIVRKTHWTDNLFSLQVAADTETFEAGQYTWLGLDIDGRRIADPYSIASAPGEPLLEFFFYTRLEGELSTALARLEHGKSLWIARRAEGNFTLSRVPDAGTLWLMATGTGVAPFLSMLRTDEPWQRFDNIVLIYAARQAADLRYREVTDLLREQYSTRFNFLPFISREKVPDTFHGHITTAIADGTLIRSTGLELNPTDSQIMLCGNPGMVREAVALLQERGFSDNDGATGGNLSYERYW